MYSGFGECWNAKNIVRNISEGVQELHVSYGDSVEENASTIEIVRQFPNVFLNTAWMQIISPLAFKQFMKECLIGIPTSKILTYGCDEFNVLNSCACAEIYRDYMAEVLAELVDENRMTEKEAIFIANLVSRENVYDHWKLKI